MAEIDAFFKTQAQALQAKRTITNTLDVTVTPPAMVMPRNGRPWEITVRAKDVADVPMMPDRLYQVVLSIVNQCDGEIHESEPSGSRFVNNLPQSVFDRYEAEQNSRYEAEQNS